jgi:hypothetical protein
MFKIGDKIRAIGTQTQTGYGITTIENNWTGEVSDIKMDSFGNIKLLVRLSNGNISKVDSGYFELIGRHSKPKKKKMLMYNF